MLLFRYYDSLKVLISIFLDKPIEIMNFILIGLPIKSWTVRKQSSFADFFCQERDMSFFHKLQETEANLTTSR